MTDADKLRKLMETPGNVNGKLWLLRAVAEPMARWYAAEVLWSNEKKTLRDNAFFAAHNEMVEARRALLSAVSDALRENQ